METRNLAERVRVSVPVLYPSGANSAVEISFSADKCFVSDVGLGYGECLLANAADFYDVQARRAAERFGIGYDGHSLFVLWAPVDRMEGAIVTVANASAQAASLAIMRAGEDKDRRKNDEVYDRVRSIFSGSAIARSADLAGRRSVWNAHNVVTVSKGHRAIFEFVTPHQNSISNRFMMFSDLAGGGGAISLNSVVEDLDAIGTKGEMLQDVSNVIELNSSREDYRRYAEASAN